MSFDEHVLYAALWDSLRGEVEVIAAVYNTLPMHLKWLCFLKEEAAWARRRGRVAQTQPPGRPALQGAALCRALAVHGGSGHFDMSVRA